MGLLKDDDEKSLVGQLYDGLIGGLSFYKDNYIPSQNTANQMIDAGV